MTNDNMNDNPIPEEPRAPRNFSMENNPGGSTRRRREREIAGQSERAGGRSDRGGIVPPQAVAALESLASSASSGVDELRRMRQTGIAVDLNRQRRSGTPEVLSWDLIKRTTDGLRFNNYKRFMDLVLCNDQTELERLKQLYGEKGLYLARDNVDGKLEDGLRHRRFLPFTDTDAYRLLKLATEAFVTVNGGIPLQNFIEKISPEKYAQILDQFDAVDPLASDTRVSDWWQEYLVAVNGEDNPQTTLPYLVLIKEKLAELPVKRNIFALKYPSDQPSTKDCYGILADKILNPIMLELIWSYWHEEGMLVQTMGALGRRFQNVRGPDDRDPLAMIEMDPLRPLNNILWGYIQDEQHRLSVIRRAYEYSHHYGITLRGKAVPSIRPADPRSRFLEAFHFLLHQCTQFFRQDDDTTIAADGFPVLNALRELHMILSEGAHNQFGDLPTTARIEMLMEQWLLARPELREFLPRRIMVAYPEPWMDSVDSMKRLQGWGDTSILDFSYLANDGERLLLSIRYTAWTGINDAQLAGVWARMFRDEIQRYVHSYRSVTGVDLTAPITTTQHRELIAMLPSDLIQRRLKAGGNGQRALPAPQGQPVQAGLRERRAARQSTRPR